jgi:tetratricopeptide (TPR) repeat protein
MKKPPSLGASLLAAALLGGSTWALPARAQLPEADTTRAVHLNETGSELYAAGDYTGALLAFERAHALANEPNLLFNIAGCHEQLGHREQALEYYRRFLIEPGSDAGGRQRALQSIRELEAPGAAQPLPAAGDGSQHSLWEHPALPLVTLGAGMLLAGLGAGLYVDGAHDHNEVTSAPSYGEVESPRAMTEVEARTLIDSGNTKKLLGGVGLGLGGALIATHVVLSLWDQHQAVHATSEVHAELRLLPGGCLVTGGF